MSSITIRTLRSNDVQEFIDSFSAQGWHRPKSLFHKYLIQQDEGKRVISVALLDKDIAGYGTLIYKDEDGPFQQLSIPVIVDLIVFERFQNQGVGSALMDDLESHAKKRCHSVGLGVGLHAGYGSAQRLYVKRGYIPDGSGVWYQGKPLKAYAPCCNDDDLLIFLYKSFESKK